jgi:predicted dehydrogenase
MSSKKVIRFGIIGCGLMGKEFASAAGRWCHLGDVGFEPKIIAVCDPNPAATAWFTSHVGSVEKSVTDYRELLSDKNIDAGWQRQQPALALTRQE